jgi:hypothetical protein
MRRWWIRRPESQRSTKSRSSITRPWRAATALEDRLPPAPSRRSQAPAGTRPSRGPGSRRPIATQCWHAHRRSPCAGRGGDTPVRTGALHDRDQLPRNLPASPGIQPLSPRGRGVGERGENRGLGARSPSPTSPPPPGGRGANPHSRSASSHAVPGKQPSAPRAASVSLALAARRSRIAHPPEPWARARRTMAVPPQGASRPARTQIRRHRSHLVRAVSGLWFRRHRRRSGDAAAMPG